MKRTLLILIGCLLLIINISYADVTHHRALELNPKSSVDDTPVFKVENTSGATRFSIDLDGNSYQTGNVSLTGNMTQTGNLSVTGNISGMIVRITQYVVSPAVPDSDSLIGNNNTRIDSCTGSGTPVNTQPDVPRTVYITLNHPNTWEDAAGAGAVGVYGIDAKGNSTYESLTLGTGGGTPALTLQTSRAWSIITAIVVDSTLAGTASYTDTMGVGYGPKIGLVNDVYGDTIYKYIDNGVDISTDGLMTGTVNATYDTYEPATAVAGNDIVIYYKAKIKGESE